MDASFPVGVRPLEHTADVGLEIRAPSLEALFHRAALGTMALLGRAPAGADDSGAIAAVQPAHAASVESSASVEGARTDVGGADALKTPEPAPPQTGPASRRLVLESGDVAQLLVRWLREILYLHDVHGLVYQAARFDRLDTAGLDASVSGEVRSDDAVTELKAVTYHGLEVAPTADGWRARVIFDI